MPGDCPGLGEGLEEVRRGPADQRKVADLWVINALATPRPEARDLPLRDARRGELDQPELFVFDRDTKQRVTARPTRFKDQTLQIATGAAATARRATREKTEPLWLGETSRQALLHGA